MKKLDKKYEQNILKFVPKIIGVYQILGGLFLFLMSIFLSDFRMVAWAQVFLVLLVFFSIVGGYLFLKQKKYGAFLCVINQSLQIIRFQFLGFTLKYYTGISAGVIIESSFLNELSFSFNLTPGASFILGPIYTMNDFFGLNVIPILFIYYIYRHKEILTKM
ncbi:hypothetical protein [uncultured Aquimarina sp.]|uniref:hypothetical protein n=1 Tax=uncultured Aquimarina sp. TaxID=575652 RepID=UPI0026179E79|nr:hypothetical protein [uncultured Aquimarina sp.]